MTKVLIVGGSKNYYAREMCFFRGFEQRGCEISIYLLDNLYLDNLYLTEHDFG